MVRARQTERTQYEYQRTRILAAMVTAAFASGPESVTVSDITGLPTAMVQSPLFSKRVL